MKHPEMKLIAGVISLRSVSQNLNFISSDKILCKHNPEAKSYKQKQTRKGI